MNYFKIGLSAVAVIIVSLLVYDYAKTKQEFERQATELKITAFKLQEQNEAIKSMEVDLTSYKSKKPKVIEKIVTKYQRIEVKDETCESYMAAIYNAQVEFFKRHSNEKDVK